MVRKPHASASDRMRDSAVVETPGRVRLYEDRIEVLPDNALDAESLPFDSASFASMTTVAVQRLGANYMEFDVVGVAPAIANALRRVMISEIPTMAIETVFVINNTSIIPDEVLSHRLGLVPIFADPRKFESTRPGESENESNSLFFELRARCFPNGRQGLSSDAPATERLTNACVYSSAITWIPQGNQAEALGTPARPADSDILLLKMRQGQEVDLELHCVKGIGKDHAKWSPVSCATYRLMPRITILEPILGDLADRFAGMFPPGVVEVHGTGPSRKAAVVCPRKDTVTREVLRHAEFSDKVILSRVYDHFIFRVETVGFFGPVDVVREALGVLMAKCDVLRDALNEI